MSNGYERNRAMTKAIPVQPKNLQCGDTLVVRNADYTVVDITGPDRIGTYDVTVMDNSGAKHLELVMDTVTIKM